MPVLIVESLEQFEKTIEEGKVVIVDYFAEWCGPCKVIAPKVEAMSNDPLFKECVFLKVNVDDCDDIAAKYGISAMPTFHIFKGGKKVDELVGANEAKLKEIIQKNA